MGMDYVIVEEVGAVVIAIGAASASATIPPGFERVGIITTGNCHWRMGKGAQTAIATDPLITSTGPGPLIVKVKPTGSGLSDTIAVIQDGASTGNFSVFGVRES